KRKGVRAGFGGAEAVAAARSRDRVGFFASVHGALARQEAHVRARSHRGQEPGALRVQLRAASVAGERALLLAQALEQRAELAVGLGRSVQGHALLEVADRLLIE